MRGFVVPEPTGQAGNSAERLARLRSECGCAWGAGAMCLGLVGSLAVIGMTYGTVAGFLLHAPISLGVAIVAGGIGKAVAISIARFRYRRELALVARTLSSASEV